MAKVIIGVDPHKLSATIEVVDTREKLLGSGGSPLTSPGTSRCGPTRRPGLSGSGRSLPGGRFVKALDQQLEQCGKVLALRA